MPEGRQWEASMLEPLVSVSYQCCCRLAGTAPQEQSCSVKAYGPNSAGSPGLAAMVLILQPGDLGPPWPAIAPPLLAPPSIPLRRL